VTDKLEGFPKVYYINMDEAVDRNNYMIDMLKKSGITNYERSLGRKAKKSKHLLLSKTQYGCVIAHLEAICKVANGPDEYAVILEDDADLLVSQYWDFTWKEFIERVPDFDVLQLFRISIEALSGNSEPMPNDFDNMIRFKKWQTGDVLAPAYMISKKHAQRLQQKFIKSNGFLSEFENLSESVGPVADHIVYANANTYSVSIFTTELFTSQIGDQHNWVPYLNLLKLFHDEVQNDFTLDRIFTTYESDNVIFQA